MTYRQLRPLTDHVDDIIDIWFDSNKVVTTKGVEALKNTIRLTLTHYYGERK